MADGAVHESRTVGSALAAEEWNPVDHPQAQSPVSMVGKHNLYVPRCRLRSLMFVQTNPILGPHGEVVCILPTYTLRLFDITVLPCPYTIIHGSVKTPPYYLSQNNRPVFFQLPLPTFLNRATNT